MGALRKRGDTGSHLSKEFCRSLAAADYIPWFGSAAILVARHFHSPSETTKGAGWVEGSTIGRNKSIKQKLLQRRLEAPAAAILFHCEHEFVVALFQRQIDGLRHSQSSECTGLAVSQAVLSVEDRLSVQIHHDLVAIAEDQLPPDVCVGVDNRLREDGDERQQALTLLFGRPVRTNAEGRRYTPASRSSNAVLGRVFFPHLR